MKDVEKVKKAFKSVLKKYHTVNGFFTQNSELYSEAEKQETVRNLAETWHVLEDVGRALQEAGELEEGDTFGFPFVIAGLAALAIGAGTYAWHRYSEIRLQELKNANDLMKKEVYKMQVNAAKAGLDVDVPDTDRTWQEEVSGAALKTLFYMGATVTGIYFITRRL